MTDERLIQGRMREHLVGVLEDLVSPDALRAYAERVPLVGQGVPAEVLDQWADMHGDEPDLLTEPTFTAAELAAVRRFNVVWRDAAGELPLEAWLESAEYAAVRAAAEDALRVVRLRRRPPGFADLDHILWTEDPIGLRDAGAPRAEYEAEAGTILPLLRRGQTSEDVRAIVHAEFGRWFGADTAGPAARYDRIAARIVEELLPLLPG